MSQIILFDLQADEEGYYSVDARVNDEWDKKWVALRTWSCGAAEEVVLNREQLETLIDELVKVKEQMI